VNGAALATVEVRHACGAPPLGLRLTVDARTIAYSGDTEWTDALIELARGADLFVVEALCFDRKIAQHLDYATFRANADRIGARRVILTHFGPQMLSSLQEARHETAEDGKFIEV
jgi:ribonuclease BN (tRNA processing enzyme)